MEKKITVHFYHTNQKGMVQGQLHQQFFNQFFHPLLEKLCSEKANQISQFNNTVINTLKPGRLCLAERDSSQREQFETDQKTAKDIVKASAETY